jgi:hypothetical protein
MLTVIRNNKVIQSRELISGDKVLAVQRKIRVHTDMSVREEAIKIADSVSILVMRGTRDGTDDGGYPFLAISGRILCSTEQKPMVDGETFLSYMRALAQKIKSDNTNKSLW